jgi:hypothetical protein
LFSGRFELTPDAEGAYFIDRNGKHFELILDFLRDSGNFKLVSSDMTEGSMQALAVELNFFGLFERMMPYHTQEMLGQALLQRACLSGTKVEQQTAVAQARALVFDIGSTTSFLRDVFQDLRFVITDRTVNKSPVWAAVDGKHFMYRDKHNRMQISTENHCAGGIAGGSRDIFNTEYNSRVMAPTELLSTKWASSQWATLESQYASTERRKPGSLFVYVPYMRITVVHGLDDSNPTMASALRQLVARNT